MARSPVQQQSLAPVILAAGLLAAGAGVWFGLPGIAALPIAVVVAAWSEPPAVLTGKKDASGQPTPAGPGEVKMLRRYRMWSELRWKVLLPSKDWLPGWPVLASWLVAVLAAAVAVHLPVNVGVFRAVNAFSAWLVVATTTSVRRRHIDPDDVCPGVRVDSFVPAVKTDRGRVAAVAAAVSIPVVTFFAFRFFTGQIQVVDPVTGDVVETMSRWQRWFRFAPGVDILEAGDVPALPGMFNPLVASLLVAVAVALAIFAYPWVEESMAWWRQLREARLTWAQRWSVVRQFRDDAPVLVDMVRVGPAEQFTFEAPLSVGSVGMAAFLDKLAPAIGAGVRTVFLDVPEEGPSGPTPGSVHPSRFVAVLWPSGQEPDLCDPDLDQEVAELWLRSGMAWVAAENRFDPVPLDEAVRVEAADGKSALWRTTWHWRQFGALTVRSNMIGALSSALHADVLVHHREKFGGPAVYVGDVQAAGFDESSAELTAGKDLADLMWECHTEDRWTKAWYTALKTGTNEPVPQFGSAETRTLADGTPVERLAFAVREGQDPTSFFGLEAKMSAALQKPFFALTGWPAPGDRAGSRHHQGFCTYAASSAAVPSTPDRLGPSPASTWVLAAHVNQMFRAAKFPQPELVLDESECLTAPRSKGHIWKATVRLYGGATLADIRGRADRLRTAAGVPWLRVEPEGERCIIYLGAEPSGVTLSPSADATHLESLDWSQAFIDSGVRGVSGGVPVLVERSTLPNNEKVSVLDFELPTGVDLASLKESVEKLKVATGNLFIDARPGRQAKVARLLVCAENPLGWPLSVDFAEIDRAEKGLPFATDVAGETVAYEVSESPHALLAGASGSGKTVAAQTLVYGALVKGWELWVLDASKGGADFGFAEDYAQFFARDVFECAAAIKTVYDEVVRRKDLNTQYSTGSIKELPEEIRPPQILVVLDEFTSLIGAQPLPPRSDDPEMMMERERIELSNLARLEVGQFTGKIAREARSAGVTVLLVTQKLMSDSLSKGLGDLKDQLARVLLGKASSGQKMSTLRDFENAPKVQGEMRPGRGLWESSVSSAEVIQAWFAMQDEFRENLESRSVAPVAKQDISRHLRRPDEDDSGQDGFPAPAVPVVAPTEDVVVDVGSFTFSLDDLEDEADDAGAEVVEAAVQAVPAFEDGPDLAETSTPSTGTVRAVRFVPVGAAETDHDVELDEAVGGTAANGWWVIDAVCDWLNDHPDTDTVTIAMPGVDDQNPLGGTNRESAVEVIEMFGVDVRFDTTPVVPPAHTNSSDHDEDDEDDFGPMRSAGPVGPVTNDF